VWSVLDNMLQKKTLTVQSYCSFQVNPMNRPSL